MNELTLQLDVSSKVHLYQQIYEYIKDEIRRGKLLTDEKLPSTRALAEYLQISRSTVDLAYEQLLSEGYIQARPCCGYFVCQIEDLFTIPEKERVQTHEVQRPEQTYEIDFALNGIDMEGFPFATWKSVYKNTLSNHSDEIFLMGSAQGEPTLRETISRYLHASRGVNCTPDQIVIGAGNDYLLILLEKILGRNRKIAMEDPSYKRAYRAFSSCHYDMCMVDMDRNGMRVETLQESGADIAYVMPSHQYPMGIVMPIGRRMELLKWATEREERYIVEDDYDSEFRYKGKPIPSLQASDKHGKVIYIGTFSKSIAPAIRVSYMVLPERLLESYEQNAGFMASTVSRTDQMMLNDFIGEGYFERHLNKMRKRYKAKHDLLLGALEPFEKRFRVTGENAGLHILLHAKDNSDEKILLQQAERAGVRVHGLTEAFIQRADRPEKAVILLGYGGLSEKEIIAGIEKLREGWNI
ncbi:MAG: PLP-dependent aminotransferase family protein [Lachnospiraceae bacterium]|nr:PLP-dependent aminotransferase family protein [Lachnospiraceae bacterium]